MVEAQLDRWAQLGVEGQFAADRGPWFTDDETFREPMARIVGARPSEVAVLNTLTVNLHLMLASFFRPAGPRRQDPHRRADLPVRPARARQPPRLPRPGPGGGPGRGRAAVGRGHSCVSRTSRARSPRPATRLALVLFDGVNFATGQALPVGRLTEAAPSVGAVVGWEMAHGAGNVPLALHDDGVDFAVWCTYKYLNGGPGSVGSIFVHERHTAAGRPDVAAPDRLVGRRPRPPIRPGGPVRRRHRRGRLEDVDLAALQHGGAGGVAGDLRRGRHAGAARALGPADRLPRGAPRELGVEILTPSDPDARGAQLSLPVRGCARRPRGA